MAMAREAKGEHGKNPPIKMTGQRECYLFTGRLRVDLRTVTSKQHCTMYFIMNTPSNTFEEMYFVS